MSEHHVVVGSGPVGTAVALLLAERGGRVTVVTRRGGGPEDPRVTRAAVDATDTEALAGVAAGATAVYNCANPPYHRWSTDWPPLAASLLATAERTGAVLVTMSNLYGYGEVEAPMTEQTPLAATGTKGRIRAQMWRDALAAHDQGRIRATEARASDFYGPAVTEGGHLGSRFVPRVLAGKAVRVVGDPDAPHSWTYLPDVAATMVALATDERAWGRAWHVPTDAPRSQREVAAAISRLAGAPAAMVKGTPRWLLRAVGLTSPMLREMDEVYHQFAGPFVLDSTAAQRELGLTFTPFDEGLAATVAWWEREHRAA